MMLYRKLSDPEVKSQYNNYISSERPKLECAIKNHAISVNSHMIELSMIEPCFVCVRTVTLSVSELLKKFSLSSVSDLMPHIDEMFSDVGKGDSEGFLLDFDSSKPLYLKDAGVCSREHYIINDALLLRVERMLSVEGEDSGKWLFAPVDLRFFAKRLYDHESFVCDVSNINDQDVLVPVNDSGDLRQEILDGFTVQSDLLVSWVKHQFLKQVFSVTFDPFYERDGLIHQKYDGYREKSPEYKLPDTLVRFRELMEQCEISRRYSNEVF